MDALLEKNRIITIIGMFFPHAKIYLFGSYARGDFGHSSDIDIAIDNLERLPIVEKQQIKNMIEALNMTQNVDIVDFNSVPQEFQQSIIKEGILWKN